jgi:hypothetical protein
LNVTKRNIYKDKTLEKEVEMRERIQKFIENDKRRKEEE